MRKTKKCTHNDCFTCPYEDCISSKDPGKKRPGRKRLPPEVRKRHRKEQPVGVPLGHSAGIADDEDDQEQRYGADVKIYDTHGCPSFLLIPVPGNAMI